MTGHALPRGTCPACGSVKPVRRNGTMREHRAMLSRDPLRFGPCPGNGEPAEESPND